MELSMKESSYAGSDVVSRGDFWDRFLQPFSRNRPTTKAMNRVRNRLEAHANNPKAVYWHRLDRCGNEGFGGGHSRNLADFVDYDVGHGRKVVRLDVAHQIPAPVNARDVKDAFGVFD